MTPTTAGIFTNWAGNQSCTPEHYAQPRTIAEIVARVQAARQAGKRLKVVGAGHSWSANWLSSHYLLNLDALSTPISADPTTQRVWLQAGMRLKNLHPWLYDKGLAMANLGSISEQSIAGAINTGTHGTGIRYGSISTQVRGIRLITGLGQEIEISENEHSEWLPGAAVGLGALGVLTAVELQCVPKYHLHEHSFPQSFEAMLGSFAEVHHSAVDHAKWWWFPHTDTAWASHFTRTQADLKPFSTTAEAIDAFLQRRGMGAFLAIGQVLPSLRPAINRIAVQLGFKNRQRIDLPHRVFNVPMPLRHLEFEYAVPAEQAAHVLRQMNDLITREKLKVNFVVEIRFVRGDELWLSPAYGRDSCFIGCFMAGEYHWKTWSEGFERICQAVGGRPHWGKDFTTGQAYLSGQYPRWSDFLALRQELDPHKTFYNPWLERVLGP
jgi:L-gulonolactone oxidase